ncbi:protein of unknown function DUF115 [Pyrobaculum islandicum DSM 4184]|uniref:DUF115 domain-containing protein n=1 Tax=Pyrobaculum islandicum (strain DSM 4184 / JCM 9189 / GEO3) TaxID=384616 RepID=A1RTD3_PYRIL|nr:hypothetical protein [Pyrobaculum islandicum]ABL88215.1 protein of unknown function DUF115 [Pyrobaculum islandicum DSM 4184]
MSCKPTIFDPAEWAYVITLAKALLPELSFHRDNTATEIASRLNGISIEVLRDFNWEAPVIYMPPFEILAEGTVTIAVEGYTAKKLLRRNIKADVVVSDLDFEPDGVELGKTQVVHVHGDNYWRIPNRRWVYTVQTWPIGCTFNISGFTDGDRAAYLAYYMGARELTISGFYPHIVIKRSNDIKRRKLAVATHLLYRLSLRIPIHFL